MANSLSELSELARESGSKYPRRRALFGDIVQGKGKAFTGIVGPRGVGKTVLLRQLASEVGDSFYISADTLGQADLFETAKNLARSHGVRLLLLDEIHEAPDYAASLKRIYDFLDLRVVFTSSVALSLVDSAHDLSRRAVLRHLWPFSFGEYLLFAHGIALRELTLAEILARGWDPGHMRHGYLFEGYLKGGLFPFALEEADARPILEGILGKIIRQDIPSVGGLRLDEVASVERAVQFVGRSACDGISYSSVSRNVGITKYKAEQYIRLLEDAYVLNPVLPAGTNVLREPKVLMQVPFRLLYRDYDDAAGGLREDFAVQALKMAGRRVQYLKSKQGEKTPDFLSQEDGKDLVLEVGGRGKGRSQFKGFRAKRKLVLTPDDSAEGDRRPLFLLGFLRPV